MVMIVTKNPPPNAVVSRWPQKRLHIYVYALTDPEQKGALKGRIFIVSHGLTDKEALALEAAPIWLIGNTNAVVGHTDKLKWLENRQIDKLYDKSVERSDSERFQGNIVSPQAAEF